MQVVAGVVQEVQVPLVLVDRVVAALALIQVMLRQLLELQVLAAVVVAVVITDKHRMR
jgi:hypothetical protein